MKKLRGYKRCFECGQPMLKKGQRRKHPDDYRHAQGCPHASKYEQRRWRELNKEAGE